MTESLFSIVQASTKEVVNTTPYLPITCDGVTMLDNQPWINIFIYTIQRLEKYANVVVLAICD